MTKSLLVWRATFTGAVVNWPVISRSNCLRWLDVARRLQSEADAAGVGQPDANRQDNAGKRSLLDRFDESITLPTLRSASRELFKDGHYARAVEEAFKCLDNLVKEKSELPDAYGADLMRTAFSPKKPLLRLNDLLSKSQQDEQQGYMDIFAGSMTGIRNPRAHEHELVDEPEVALELLTLANHLMRQLKNAIRIVK